MSVQEILTGGGGLLLVLMTLIQVAPVKINPWSWLAKAIGRAINAEVIKKLDAHITMDDRRTADGHRARILHFNNELLRGIEHTKEEFIERANIVRQKFREMKNRKSLKYNWHEAELTVLEGSWQGRPESRQGNRGSLQKWGNV